MCEPFTAPVDNGRDTQEIKDFIQTLPSPQKEICHAIIIQHLSRTETAKMLNIKRAKLLAIIRNALKPLALEFNVNLKSPNFKR